MKAFFTQLAVQFKLDLRERGTLMNYYLVPLVFYLVMGAVYSSVNPAARPTLGVSMIIFGVTMGAVLGMPTPVVRLRETGVLRAYQASGIPAWAVLFVLSTSAFLHLLIASTIIFVTAPLLFGAGYPVSFVGFFLTLVVLLFASIGLGSFVGVTASNQSMAVMLSQAIFLPTVMLSGIMFPTSLLPKALDVLGHLLPGTYAMQSFSMLAFRTSSTGSTFIPLLVVLAIGLVATGLTVVRFRKIEQVM